MDLTGEFTYDANGQRTSVSVTPPGGASASVVNDVYQLGHLAYQTNGSGVLLASFTYDSQGTPVSVQVGSDPSTAPRYYYVYNGHGDVTYLTDTSGAVVASYLYDAWGNQTSSSESFAGGANGWTNPYRYDGRDGARYDASDGLYWLSVRAYDPSLGRFLSRDPLGRAPLFVGGGNPYVYAGNNPLSNVDPSGQRVAHASAAQVKQAAKRAASTSRMKTVNYAAIARGQHRAHVIAIHASEHFKAVIDSISWFLVACMAIVGAVLMFQVENPGVVAIGGFLVGWAASFGLWREELNDLVSMFDKESANPDSWFTLRNVEGFKRDLLSKIESSAYDVLIAAGIILATLPFIKNVAESTGSTIATGSFAAVLGLLMEAPDMANTAKEAVNYISSEEAALYM